MTDSAVQHARQRAIALKAATVQEVLHSTLRFVLDKLTVAQVNQMQRVLDAAVVNPEVLNEATAIAAKSYKIVGSLKIIDAAMVHRKDRVMRNYIYVNKSDKAIRLDYKSLIESDALTPRTDNPDEADYLDKVRQTLEKRGVWLRFEPKLVRDPEDLSRRFYDIRQYDVWLTLGPDGDGVPTKTGRIDRDSILGTTLFGAGYYRAVDQGKAQTALEREERRLISEIESGQMQHQMLAKIRRDAPTGVAWISDKLGGGDFPSQVIWDQPHKLVVKALELNVGGRIYGSQVFLIAAAVVTRRAAKLLASYIDDTGEGAARAVAVLKIARAAGKAAEVGLAVMTGAAVVDGVGVAVVGGEVGSAGAAEAAIDQAAERLATRYAARNGVSAGELNSVRWVGQPAAASKGVRTYKAGGGL